MAKYPKLTHKEINDEVVKRTGQSNQLVAAIIQDNIKKKKRKNGKQKQKQSNQPAAAPTA